VVAGMKPTCIRLVKPVTAKSLNLRHTSASLLPPIPLYRALLRAHRALPFEMRFLGDEYVKSEFRRHKDITNPVYIMGFLTQWKMYLDQLPAGPDAHAYGGKKLDPTIFEKMSPEQLAQLYEVMHVTKDVWKPVESAGEAQEMLNP